MKGLFPLLEIEETDCANLPRANSRPAWNSASFSRKAHLGILLCEKRKPDGLFTFNKIILEEIVISHRNFLASSAILASKLIHQEGWGCCWEGEKKPGKGTEESRHVQREAWSADAARPPSLGWLHSPQATHHPLHKPVDPLRFCFLLGILGTIQGPRRLGRLNGLMRVQHLKHNTQPELPITTGHLFLSLSFSLLFAKCKENPSFTHIHTHPEILNTARAKHYINLLILLDRT